MSDVLMVSARLERSCVILDVSGEFTRYQFGRFIGRVRQEVRPGIRKVIVDAGGLTHMSPSALGEVAETCRVLNDGGCQLVMVGLAPRIRRMLAVSALDKLIPVALTVEDALGAE